MRVEKAIGKIAERTARNNEYIQESLKQRRNSVVDLYGIPYYASGDAGTPATIYISVSPDRIYFLRFQFKLIIRPFMSTVKGDGISSETVTVIPRSLSVSNDTISPNPHTHTTDAHTHSYISGVALTHTTSSTFGISVDGVDVTPYLAAQYDEWVDGEGVFPSENVNDSYDLLEVASVLVEEGNKTAADKILSSGFKKIEITSDGPFAVEMHTYLKYSHLNR